MNKKTGYQWVRRLAHIIMTEFENKIITKLLEDKKFKILYALR